MLMTEKLNTVLHKTFVGFVISEDFLPRGDKTITSLSLNTRCLSFLTMTRERFHVKSAKKTLWGTLAFSNRPYQA